MISELLEVLKSFWIKNIYICEALMMKNNLLYYDILAELNFTYDYEWHSFMSVETWEELVSLIARNVTGRFTQFSRWNFRQLWHGKPINATVELYKWFEYLSVGYKNIRSRIGEI